MSTPAKSNIERKAIAMMILDQLGGRAFMAMTGAKNLAVLDSGLSFSLPGTPGFVRDGINHVRLTLNALDTYDIDWGRVWGTKYRVVIRDEHIYNDSLQALFGERTGLATSLGTLGGRK
jgi:hypothetical protein